MLCPSHKIFFRRYRTLTDKIVYIFCIYSACKLFIFLLGLCLLSLLLNYKSGQFSIYKLCEIIFVHFTHTDDLSAREAFVLNMYIETIEQSHLQTYIVFVRQRRFPDRKSLYIHVVKYIIRLYFHFLKHRPI